MASLIKKANSSAISGRIVELFGNFFGQDSFSRRKRAFEDKPNDGIGGIIKSLLQRYQVGQEDKRKTGIKLQYHILEDGKSNGGTFKDMLKEFNEVVYKTFDEFVALKKESV